MNAKDDLLNRAASQYKAFYEAIEGLNEGQLTEAWLGTWSIRDIVAHMTGWHREMIPVLERLTRGERPVPEGVSYEDVDNWNARFVAARAGWQVSDVLLELDQSHEDFMRVAAQVPDVRVQPGKTAYRIIDQNSAHHYQEHAAQIRAWRVGRSL